jgi:kynureninase
MEAEIHTQMSAIPSRPFEPGGDFAQYLESTFLLDFRAPDHIRLGLAPLYTSFS